MLLFRMLCKDNESAPKLMRFKYPFSVMPLPNYLMPRHDTVNHQFRFVERNSNDLQCLQFEPNLFCRESFVYGSQRAEVKTLSPSIGTKKRTRTNQIVLFFFSFLVTVQSFCCD